MCRTQRFLIYHIALAILAYVQSSARAEFQNAPISISNFQVVTHLTPEIQSHSPVGACQSGCGFQFTNEMPDIDPATRVDETDDWTDSPGVPNLPVAGDLVLFPPKGPGKVILSFFAPAGTVWRILTSYPVAFQCIDLNIPATYWGFKIVSGVAKGIIQSLSCDVFTPTFLSESGGVIYSGISFTILAQVGTATAQVQMRAEKKVMVVDETLEPKPIDVQHQTVEVPVPISPNDYDTPLKAINGVKDEMNKQYKVQGSGFTTGPHVEVPSEGNSRTLFFSVLGREENGDTLCALNDMDLQFGENGPIQNVRSLEYLGVLKETHVSRVHYPSFGKYAQYPNQQTALDELTEMVRQHELFHAKYYEEYLEKVRPILEERVVNYVYDILIKEYAFNGSEQFTVSKAQLANPIYAALDHTHDRYRNRICAETLDKLVKPKARALAVGSTDDAYDGNGRVKKNKPTFDESPLGYFAWSNVVFDSDRGEMCFNTSENRVKLPNGKCTGPNGTWFSSTVKGVWGFNLPPNLLPVGGTWIGNGWLAYTRGKGIWATKPR